ncbi:MAG TPA: hypothetical protein PLF80_12875 [Flavobacteriales bacterium]|nr:hypothetical protein [Flavobacteriales bacterium]
MAITRDATNKITVDGRETLASPRFLLHFYSTQTCANVYCITTNSGGSGGPLLLTFDEVGDSGTVAPTSGDIKLSPPGWWELSIYEQTSITNLDPANATRLVASMGVEVVGESCTASAYTPNQCPDGGECDTATVNVYFNGALVQTLSDLSCGDTQTINIS